MIVESLDMTKVALLKSRLNYRGGLEKYTKISLKNIHAISLANDSKFSLTHTLRFNALCNRWLRAHPHEVIFGMERAPYQTHYRAGSGLHAVYLKQRKLTDSLLKRSSFYINPLHRMLLQNEKKAFEHPELKVLFTNSAMVQREILNTYATPTDKIFVVHNGVEWYKKQQPFEASLIRPKQKVLHLLFIGNDYRRKGLIFLLKGLERLRLHDFQLTVVGRDKRLAGFKELAARLKLEKKVHFVGAQSSLLPFYQAADALVIPSIYDPFANVTIEALAMGLFVISSKFNGGHEVLTATSGCVIEELTSATSVASSIEKAFLSPKTPKRAQSIRDSIKELDFSNQLDKIVQKTLETV